MARKKQQKKKKIVTQSGWKHTQEIFGIILFSLALFIFLSLISYHPQDPSLNTAVESTEIRNYGGTIGAYTADLLLCQLFGYPALMLPFFLMAIGIRRFRKEPSSHKYFKVCCNLFLFIEVMALVQLRWETADLFNRGVHLKTGGLVGFYISSMLVEHLNNLGSYILLITLLIITILLLTGISIQVVVQWSQQTVTKIWRIISSIVVQWLDFFTEKRKSRKSLKTKTVSDRVIIRKKRELNNRATRLFINQEKDNEKSKEEKQEKIVEKQFVQEEIPIVKNIDQFVMPSINLLEDYQPPNNGLLKREISANSAVLLEKLENFDVTGRIVQVFPGPVITRYEFEPDPGIKLSRITSLADDLGLAIKSKVAPRVAPVPGKSVVGIEIPNKKRQLIMLKDIITSDPYQRMSSALRLALGNDTTGLPYTTALDSMPHLLVAGATGAGKSVCIHSMITSLLYSAPPDLLNLIMIDPKMLELSVYNKIPHLREPVVTSAKKAARALHWAVSEMEDRYKILAQMGVRDITLYNNKVKKMIDKGEEVPEGFPYPMAFLVIIIDELADLMMVAASDVENYIARLAQMARAAGIHLIISTQRPSVNVLTGIIKANFPSRISFQVSSKIDSRTILDENGAEKLLGKGDMLFKPATGRLIRLHGAYVSEIEVQRLVQYVSQFKAPKKEESIFKIVESKEREINQQEDYDELFDKAVRIIVQTGNASISMLQRRLRVGHSRAARLIDLMEQEGIVGPFEGSKSREVLWKPEDLPVIEED